MIKNYCNKKREKCTNVRKNNKQNKKTKVIKKMPISFACRLFPIEQVLKCSFGLNKTEVQILKHLSGEEKEYEIEQLLKKIKKDRSTIQRSVKRLTEKGLLRRKQLNLENGGYLFVYAAVPKRKIKEMINQNFERFKDAVGKEIEKW